jgi:hypothetical protein
MSSFCRGKTQAGEPCDCEEFSEPKQLNPTEFERCAECGHGRSKHPKEKNPNEGPATAVSVASIFKRHTNGRDDATSFTDARAESLTGFRKTSASSQGGSKVSFYLLLLQIDPTFSCENRHPLSLWASIRLFLSSVAST